MRHCLRVQLYLQLFSGLFGLLLTSLAQAEHARPLNTGVLQRLPAGRPGSLWLTNTGDGEPCRQWQGYFSHYLRQASQGDKSWPLVSYCRSDCWLSWNALKRAHRLGYSNLFWYRDGIDAWQQTGLPLLPA